MLWLGAVHVIGGAMGRLRVEDEDNTNVGLSNSLSRRIRYQ